MTDERAERLVDWLTLISSNYGQRISRLMGHHNIILILIKTTTILNLNSGIVEVKP